MEHSKNAIQETIQLLNSWNMMQHLSQKEKLLVVGYLKDIAQSGYRDAISTLNNSSMDISVEYMYWESILNEYNS